MYGLYLLTNTVLGAAAVLSGEKETQAQRAERQALEKEIEEDQAEADARHEEVMAREAAVRVTWSSQRLRKSSLLPGMKLSGLVVFAGREFRDLPDTLALQYLVPDHPPVELGSYTLGVDSIPRL
ncbi:MAG TPA: hypothetical protein VK465_09570 [Fibrobacteria bacterium]|nr:hypothetical protein [Fibrobacteria bacterium]